MQLSRLDINSRKQVLDKQKYLEKLIQTDLALQHAAKYRILDKIADDKVACQTGSPRETA